jgi:hypothetical protein
MRGGMNVNGGSNEDIVADLHFTYVHDHTIEVEVDPLAEILTRSHAMAIQSNLCCCLRQSLYDL